MVGTLEENGVLRILLGSPAVVPEGTQLLNGLPASCPDGFVDHEIQGGQPFFFEVSTEDVPPRLVNLCGRSAFQRRPSFLLAMCQEPSIWSGSDCRTRLFDPHRSGCYAPPTIDGDLAGRT